MGVVRSTRIPVFVLLLFVIAFAEEHSKPIYQFETKGEWLTMQDGTKLSCTLAIPKAKFEGQKFPVLLEYLPYRKDDSFLLRDVPILSYFAKRGYVVAKVDIRGTGSSEGKVIPKEYSDIELDDGMQILTLLSQLPFSNGKIGMFGKSWGAFNSIMLGMRGHPSLKTIISVHGSDDLYHDDIHYLDGVLHFDEYIVSVDHENALPRSLVGYPIDDRYFADRFFSAYPFHMTYLEHQVDGPFWRQNSLKYNISALRIPAYFIGGLYDGFRDTPTRVCEKLNARSIPCKVMIGPWVHNFPDEGWPGPCHEWKHEAVRWFDQWLLRRDTGILSEPNYVFYVRQSHLPSSSLVNVPGVWQYAEWPLQTSVKTKLFLGGAHQLTQHTSNLNSHTVHSLKYLATVGTEMGVWWGELLDDMKTLDTHSLVYDTAILSSQIEIIGFPRVSLEVVSEAPIVNWAVRLEDVHPNGAVSLVTGAIQNGVQRESSTNPEYLVPGRSYVLQFDMHFTTWRFPAGHKIRLAITNGLFRMVWPSPFATVSYLKVDTANTWMELPQILPPADSDVPRFSAVVPNTTEYPPDSFYYCKFPVTVPCSSQRNIAYPRSKYAQRG